MSNTTRPPLLSDDAKELERIAWKECATLRQGPKDPYGPMMESWNRGGFIRGIRYGQDIYEAARAKDAELIQQLVDALHIATRYNHYKTFPEEWHNSIKIWNRAMEDADAAGFKPTDQ